MKTTSLTIRLDETVKQDATALAEELGISLSNVINGYLKTFLRTRQVTFSAPKEEPTQYLINSLKESQKDYERGDVISFENTEDVFTYLDKLTLHDKKD